MNPTRHLALSLLTPLLIGCGASVPQPTASPTPSPSKGSVIVPAVSTTVHSTLLLEDPNLVMKRPEELTLGPDTFAILDNGDVVINDYLADQFAIYHHGKRTTTYEKPTAVVDMALRDGQWYVLDTDEAVTVYNPTKHGLKEVRTITAPPITGEASAYSALYFEGPNLIAKSDQPVLVDGPGPIQPPPTIEELDHAIHFTDGNTNATVPVTYGPWDVRRIAVTDQHIFYKVEDWDGEGHKTMRDFIVQFDLNGNLIHTYAIHAHAEAAGREFFARNGNLYQLWISEKTAKVFQIHPND